MIEVDDDVRRLVKDIKYIRSTSLMSGMNSTEAYLNYSIILYLGIC